MSENPHSPCYTTRLPRKSQRTTVKSRIITASGSVLALLALLLLPVMASAHGGGQPQVVDVPSGPYHVYVWTNPQPPQPGVLHVTVALVQPETQRPVLDAAVQVTATLMDTSAAPVISAATHDNATIKTYYETDMTLPKAGLWQIAVAHSDAAGNGSITFELAVQPAPLAFGPGEVMLAAALLAGGAGVLWWWWRKRRHAAHPV